MTRATYNADNTITELPSMELPGLPPAQQDYMLMARWKEARHKHSLYHSEYNAHLATLRTIPCSPECRGKWAEGKVLEEGKDYEVREVTVPADHWQDVPTKRLRVFSLPVKSEDDQPWYELIDLMVDKVNNHQSEESFIAELKKLYSLTKR